MAETVTRMQSAKNGDFKVNREQRTSTEQGGTKDDRQRLLTWLSRSRFQLCTASGIGRTRTIEPTSKSSLKGGQLCAEYFSLS